MTQLTLDKNEVRLSPVEEIEYQDGKFASWRVTGAGEDTVGISIENGDGEWYLLLRPDELAALVSVAQAALWTHLVHERDRGLV